MHENELPANSVEKPLDKISADSPETDDAMSSWVAERLGRLMAEHGVPARQQAALLNELCGVSPSQARRKLRGATWSFGEVITVVRHFGASLDQVFSASSADGVDSGTAPYVAAAPLQEATFVTDQLAVPCRVRLGAQIVGTPDDNVLLTAKNEEGWYVGTGKLLNKHRVAGPSFYADQVLLTPLPVKPRIRIAILDDDIGTSETLGEWFDAAGYAADAFTSCEQLLASSIASHDAFVIDFMLAGGDSSEAIIRRIRQTLPDAPIVLLTGKLRDGQASESDLTTMLRTANVTFFEKPVRPSVLAATIEKELDRIAHKRAD